MRVTDFAMEASNYARTQVFLKDGRQLELKIAVATGPVVSGVLGEVKPQFSLIGDTVTKVKQMAEVSQSGVLTVST